MHGLARTIDWTEVPATRVTHWFGHEFAGHRDPSVAEITGDDSVQRGLFDDAFVPDEMVVGTATDLGGRVGPAPSLGCRASGLRWRHAMGRHWATSME